MMTFDACDRWSCLGGIGPRSHYIIQAQVIVLGPHTVPPPSKIDHDPTG
jgi:hypothetical protein